MQGSTLGWQVSPARGGASTRVAGAAAGRAAGAFTGAGAAGGTETGAIVEAAEITHLPNSTVALCVARRPQCCEGLAIGSHVVQPILVVLEPIDFLQPLVELVERALA